MMKLRYVDKTTGFRRGSSILELLVAGITISAAVIIAATAMTSLKINQRGTERLQFAAQELNNQFERLTVLKWDELTPERLATIHLSENTAERIPGAHLTLSVTEVAQPRRAKQLRAQFHWPDRDQGTHPPLRLTTWVFAPKETP